MKLSNINIVLFAFLLVLTQTVSVFAQTEVRRYDVTEETDYGIVYRLPKTEIDVTLVVKAETYRKGIYQPWAKKYLAQEPKGEEQTVYSIEDVRCKLVGVPDPKKEFLVVFDKNSIAPCLYLRQGNLIASVNAKENGFAAKPLSSAMKQARDFDDQLPTLPRDYTMATTANRRAEIVANYIYELQETMNDIILGRAEQMPTDGQAMKLVLNRLKTEEQRAKRLFLGDTATRYQEYHFRIKPKEKAIEPTLLCRFSPQWGLVSNEDLSGDPLYYAIELVEQQPKMSPEAREELNKNLGLVYNLTGTGLLRLSFNDKVLLEKHLPLTQFGTVQSLNKKMFNLKSQGVTAVYFDPITGAIKRIINK